MNRCYNCFMGYEARDGLCTVCLGSFEVKKK